MDTTTAEAGRAEKDHGFKNDVQRLGEYVGQLHDDLAGIARDAGEVGRIGLAAAKAGGKEVIEAAKSKRRAATNVARGQIADHPGTVLGVAFAFGILIGLAAPAVIRSRRRAS
jgi:hypothetical protein